MKAKTELTRHLIRQAACMIVRIPPTQSYDPLHYGVLSSDDLREYYNTEAEGCQVE